MQAHARASASRREYYGTINVSCMSIAEKSFDANAGSPYTSLVLKMSTVSTTIDLHFSSKVRTTKS
jgi:hypothetical protein